MVSLGVSREEGVRHEGAGLAKECSWDPNRRGCLRVAVKVRVDVMDSGLGLERVLVLEMGTAVQVVAVGCGEGRAGIAKETKPGWDVEWAECEVDAEGVEEDRYTHRD